MNYLNYTIYAVAVSNSEEAGTWLANPKYEEAVKETIDKFSYFRRAVFP